MRWLLVLALAVLLAGCLRPLAAGAEPDRPSIRIEPPLFDGAPLWLNGTAHASPLPSEAGAAATPGEPHNCFVVRESGDAGRESYLGGVLVDLEWTAASASTARLNVTVTGPIQAPSSWSAEGASPLRLLAVAGDLKPVRTPVTVEVRPAGIAVPVPEQAMAFNVMVGVLESDLQGLAWEPCGVVSPPV